MLIHVFVVFDGRSPHGVSHVVLDESKEVFAVRQERCLRNGKFHVRFDVVRHRWQWLNASAGRGRRHVENRVFDFRRQAISAGPFYRGTQLKAEDRETDSNAGCSVRPDSDLVRVGTGDGGESVSNGGSFTIVDHNVSDS